MSVCPVAEADRGRGYQPRRARESLAHRVVARELDGFLAGAADRGHRLPPFVETTMRDFLACGLFEHGFVREATGGHPGES